MLGRFHIKVSRGIPKVANSVRVTTILKEQSARSKSNVTNVQHWSGAGEIKSDFRARRHIPSSYQPPPPRPSKFPRHKRTLFQHLPALDKEEGLTILGRSDHDEGEASANRSFNWPTPTTNETNVYDFDDYPEDPLAQKFNPVIADILRSQERYAKILGEKQEHADVDNHLRVADWISSEPGSTEDLVMTRRIFDEASFGDPSVRKELENNLQKICREETIQNFELQDTDDIDDGTSDPQRDESKRKEISKREKEQQVVDYVGRTPWKDMIVDISRVQKVTRGGTVVSYRALVIGGNARGVAGFGLGKGQSPEVATDAAKRMCHRNIFFFSPYQGSSLVHDLVGKHNSCKVVLRVTSQGFGITGHNLIRDILLAFGITNCSAKSYGRRNIYSVVYATFKAIKTHQTMDEISLARGKKFLSLDRARRLQYL